MKDRFLIWNDDNHEPCVWCNNEYVGAEFETTLKNLLYINPQSKTKECEILQICPWDFTEGEIMNNVVNNLKEIEIPSYIQEQHNINKNWNKNISPKFTKNVIKNAEKLKDALKKLSKN